MDPKWTRNGPKVDPKWTHTVTHMQMHLELDTHTSEDHPNVQVAVAHFVLRRCEGEFLVEDRATGVDSRIRQASRRAIGPLFEKGSPHQHNVSGRALGTRRGGVTQHIGAVGRIVLR